MNWEGYLIESDMLHLN